MVFYQVVLDSIYLLGVCSDREEATDMARALAPVARGLQIAVFECGVADDLTLDEFMAASMVEYPKTLDGLPTGLSRLQHGRPN